LPVSNSLRELPRTAQFFAISVASAASVASQIGANSKTTLGAALVAPQTTIKPTN